MSRQGKKLRHFILVSLLDIRKLLKERICSNISIGLYPPGVTETVPFVKMAGKHGCAPIHLKGNNVLLKRANSVLQEQFLWRRYSLNREANSIL